VGKLGDGNRFVRQTALRMLADKQDAGVVAALEGLLESPANGGVNVRLEALWALRQLGWMNAARAEKLMGHPDPQVRLWTVRWAGDEGHVAGGVAARMTALAGTEGDVEVRAQLACTARRMKAAEGMPVVRTLMMHDEDARDPRQPLLLWWAVEGWCETDRDAVVSLMQDRELWRAPLVQEHLLARLARRWTATGKSEDLKSMARLFRASPDAPSTARLVKGFEEATRGRALPALPEELVAAMESAGADSVLIGLRRGKPDAIARALQVVSDEKADAGLRVQWIHALGEVRAAGATRALLALVRDAKNADVRRAALGALPSQDDASVGTELVAMLGSLPGPVRGAAVSALASRPGWAMTLMRAMESGGVPLQAVPMDVARRLKALPGDEARRLTGRLWPSLKQATTADMEKEIARLVEVVNAATGNPYPGKKLFVETCGGCHRLFARGGEVGPDLTTYQRTDLANLVLNIVNPGAEVREGYEAFIAETKDGRSMAGFVVEKDAQRVVLRTSDGPAVALATSELASLEPMGGSLMPEGLIAGLTDQQVRDLFAYLRSTQPLND
jgi:putative heme-binding domain-containing protein